MDSAGASGINYAYYSSGRTRRWFLVVRFRLSAWLLPAPALA